MRRELRSAENGSMNEWVDALNKQHVDVQPTHWRNWTVRH
jgi:hypothetical protein